MGEALQDLLEQLRLERIEQNLFRGQSRDLGWGTVFGGQVLGQALSAAAQTVPGERAVHSLHSYFLRPGDPSMPIVYDVDCIRDGKSFTTRRVVAIQKGRPIFNLSSSFQIHEEGYEHHAEMPEVPAPEDLIPDNERARKYIDKYIDRIPPKMRHRFTAERPIEARSIDPSNPLQPTRRPAKRCVWYRANGRLPDEPAVHRYVLAYASDSSFLGTCMQPHAISWLTPGMQVASLDHAMWFHRPFRFDDWLLYSIDSPSASGARGLVRGQFFTRDGTLVASAVQEGLIRQRG